MGMTEKILGKAKELENKEEIVDNHPMGDFIKIKAHALSSTEKKSQIFVSINKYTVEFQQNTEVKIREKFVVFLEKATIGVPCVVDGKPSVKQEPLYAVSRLQD